MSMVVERTKVVLQDGGKGRDDYSVLVSVGTAGDDTFCFTVQ